jgi:hypothetical protein
VERSEGRFVALHAALGDALAEGSKDPQGGGGIAAAGFGAATGAVGAAWGLGTGVASGVASAGFGLFGAAPKPKPTTKAAPVLEESPAAVAALCQLPELPPLRTVAKDRSVVCRGLERYLIRLLELDDRWTDAGRQESFLGVAFGAKSQGAVADPLPFLNAHRALMEFLDDK